MKWVTRSRASRTADRGARCTAESAGLWAISQGFGDQVAKDDAEIVERASFIYDALLVHLRQRTNAQ